MKMNWSGTRRWSGRAPTMRSGVVGPGSRRVIVRRRQGWISLGLGPWEW